MIWIFDFFLLSFLQFSLTGSGIAKKGKALKRTDHKNHQKVSNKISIVSDTVLVDEIFNYMRSVKEKKYVGEACKENIFLIGKYQFHIFTV